MDIRLLLGDFALVDQCLHIGVVGRQGVKPAHALPRRPFLRLDISRRLLVCAPMSRPLRVLRFAGVLVLLASCSSPAASPPGSSTVSDAAADVSGQVFAVRANEIFLMSQSRPLRAMHTAEGWTAQTVAERVIPALRPSFYRLDRSQDVFDWDPV